jgi:CheY-like chemotaxis protein
LRNEIIRFLASRDSQDGAKFFTALGLEITLLARIAFKEGSAGPSMLASLHEMQHCCLGQLNAYLHGVDDLFPADATVEILYHYARQAGVEADFSEAINRARKIALPSPAPTANERRVLLLATESETRSRLSRLLTRQKLVVFEAETPAEALDKAEWVEPHLAVAALPADAVAGFVETFRASGPGGRAKVLLLGKAGAPGVDKLLSPAVNDSAFEKAAKNLASKVVTRVIAKPARPKTRAKKAGRATPQKSSTRLRD